jgi:cytochrome c biogenesis protein CcdA
MFLSFQSFSIFLAGLVNGINPCSMSMLIFFISLILTKSVNIMKVGIAYCIGKFISFLLLGTIFYKLLSKLNLTLFSSVFKLVTFSIISVLFIMNLKDYFAAKKEQYENVKLQLPQKLRKLNHFLIKKLSGFTNIKFFLLASFALGFFLSFGEFLCTGQIYLATIITVYQTNESMSLQALFYLIVYVTGFVTPLILISYFLYKGKAVFLLSEFIRTRLHYIKLISAGVFFVFSILVILYY